MSSIAREMVGASGMAFGLFLGIAIQISGMMALFGGSLRIPGVLVDGRPVDFTAAESLADAAKFFSDQPFMLIPAAFLGYFLFKPGGGMSGGKDAGPNPDGISSTPDSLAEREATFRDLEAQLAINNR